MKVILRGKARQHPEVIGMLLEDKLLNPKQVKEKLSFKDLEIESIEGSGDDRIIYVKEKKTNLLQE